MSISGCQPFSRATTLAMSSPESIRSVGTQRLWMEAPTRADWWLGFVELTTAVLTRWVRPALEPAQSNARL
jgi:hypothetical protein